MELAPPAASPRLQARFFDGRSARPQAVQAWISAGELHLQTGDQSLHHYPLREVQWPERQRHGQRQAELPGGGLLSHPEAAAWDAWTLASGLQDSLTVRWMQSWRRVALALLLSIGTLAGLWRWGVPWVADQGVALIPAAVEQQIGGQALAWFDKNMLKSSKLPRAQQEQIAERFAQALHKAGAKAGPKAKPWPAYQLHFRDAGEAMGPNAFALPGGAIVMTDALVRLLERDSPDALVGILAHELGHVQHQHGMRMALQAGMVGVVAGMVVGDFSALIAGVPAVLAQASYSRDFERESDATSRQLMLDAGIKPSVMLDFFQAMADIRKKKGGDSGLPIAFASHPADAERMRFFGAP
ncbi:Zn-dependent protease with chaperone function [Paucibacter oligotrophus]|uniref:Zn-dependent protease with chaperone function n=1 Tax=Roseateles oligotrophus TaxID=1769250 RepID=A0A840LBW5_9BURK|nr:M48 family metallopeptidase [Roseateles oligotrophus]MBB4842807.1 Zn-dependent protease with chaperone function [Roseateles oligotrophus]